MEFWVEDDYIVSRGKRCFLFAERFAVILVEEFHSVEDNWCQVWFNVCGRELGSVDFGGHGDGANIL